jgi:hypothetical protein
MSATRKRVRSNDAVENNDTYFDLLELGLSVTHRLMSYQKLRHTTPFATAHSYARHSHRSLGG